jgi:hypothetical protein
VAVEPRDDAADGITQEMPDFIGFLVRGLGRVPSFVLSTIVAERAVLVMADFSWH